VPTIEVSLPTELEAEFERLVEEEFLTREEAAEELLRAGLDAYSVSVDDDEEPEFVEGFDNQFDTAEDPGNYDDDTL